MGPGAEYTEMNKKLYLFVTVSVSFFNSQASCICRLVSNVFSLYLCPYPTSACNHQDCFGSDRNAIQAGLVTKGNISAHELQES